MGNYIIGDIDWFTTDRLSVYDLVDDSNNYVDDYKNKKGRYFGMFADYKKGKFDYIRVGSSEYYYDGHMGNRFHTAFWMFILLSVSCDQISVKNVVGRDTVCVVEIKNLFLKLLNNFAKNRKIMGIVRQKEMCGYRLTKAELCQMLFIYDSEGLDVILDLLSPGDRMVKCLLCEKRPMCMVYEDDCYYRSYYVPEIIKGLKPSEAYFDIDHCGSLVRSAYSMHHYRNDREHVHYRMGAEQNLDVESCVIALSCIANIMFDKDNVVKFSSKCYYPYETWLFTIENSTFFSATISMFLTIEDNSLTKDERHKMFEDYNSIYYNLMLREQSLQKVNDIKFIKERSRVMDMLREYLRVNGCKCMLCDRVEKFQKSHFFKVCICHSCIWYRSKKGIPFIKSKFQCPCSVCVSGVYYYEEELGFGEIETEN